MDEKLIISAEKYDIKKIRNILFAIGAVLFVFGIFISGTPRFLNPDYLKEYGPDDAMFNAFQALLVFGCPFFIIGQIFYMCMSKVELSVTNKRVYGCAAFGRRVDLPLDSISAVGTAMFKSIAITTASGAIKFGMVKNRDAIYEAVNRLLVERQAKPAVAPAIRQEVHQSNADELKKYKDLLDSGIISQEEFEAKKKQLLGL